LQACFCIISKESALCKTGAHRFAAVGTNSFPIAGTDARTARRTVELFSGHFSSGPLWISFAMNESAAQAIDRRPIATRNRKWAQAATAWLASRNVWPDAISIAGMCACIVAGVALGLTSVVYHRVFWLVAALGAQLRLTANMLDGMVALASSRASKIGELLQRGPRSRFGRCGVHQRGIRLGRKRRARLHRNDSGDLHCLRSRGRKNHRCA
jgi:hypothetical protein